MGIFGSQGEYAKLAPLFVDKFDTEPTFSKINKGYSDFDELSKINATTALSHEQGLANVIHQKHQDVINKVDAGELSPFKAVRLAKETAHAYLNDAVRRNVETSYKTDEESVKANKGKDALYGTREKNLGYHALKGGSEVAALNPYSAPENWDNTKWASEISNMVNADKEVRGPGVSLGRVPGTIEVAKDEHEFITRQKVATYGKQLLDSNPSAKAYLEDMSYGDLYNQAYAGLVNNPNTVSLPEKEKKARIYEYLTTPVNKTGTYQVKENGKIVTKKYNYSISPLQEEVEKRKEQMVNGVAGLTAFDKYDSSLSLSNIPGYGDKGKETEEGQLPSGGITMHDASDVATEDNSLLNGISDITSGKTYDVSATPIGGGIAAGGYSGSVKGIPNPDERFNAVKNKIVTKLKEYGLGEHELSGLGNTEAGRAKLAEKAKQVQQYENLHKGVYTQMFDPKQAEGLRKDVVIRGGTMKGVTFNSDNGKPVDENLNTAVKKIIDKVGVKNLLAKPSSSDAVNIKEVLKEADISGITTVIGSDGKGKLAYQMKIGGENLYAVIDDSSVKSAYSDFNSLNELQKVPKVKNKEIMNPTVKTMFNSAPNDKLEIAKKNEGGVLTYYVRNLTTKKESKPYSFEELAAKLNGAANKSLSNHQKRTFLYTENTKTADE